MKNFATMLLICVASTLISAQTTLTGAGSTFVYPIMSKWASEYHKMNPNVQVNYQSIGSGGGIRQVSEGVVDFGATDGPMNDQDLANSKVGKLLHVPVVMGADVPAYNVPGVTTELKFTPEALAGIFLGKITKWSDPEIAGPIRESSCRTFPLWWSTARTEAVPHTSGPTTSPRSALSGTPKWGRIPL